MSPDLRNSISLWIGGVAYFGVFWASLHFNLFRGVGRRFGVILGIVAVIHMTQLLWGLWQRRASNPANPNRL